MSTTTMSQRLRDLRNGLFPDIETVNAVLDRCIAQAEAQEGQAIGEQTPVAWRNVRRIDLRIPVRLHNALASLAMDTIGAIVDHLGVKVNDDWDGTYWRLRTALMKMRGVGRSSAIEGASAIMEAMDRPSPITPEARDRAIEALDLSKEALPYAYDDRNGNTVTPWNLEVTRAIKKVDQAISALRGS